MCPSSILEHSDFLMKEYYLKKNPPELLRKMEKFAFNTTDDMAEICKKQLLYKAAIIFKLSSHTMAVTVNSRRLSFFDKLSCFGKEVFLHKKLDIISQW